MIENLMRLRGRNARGFTMVELMVVVAIIAILAAFAVPNYLRYGVRARRSDGQQALQRMASAQERYYSTNNAYAKTLTLLSWTQTTSEKQYYNLSLDAATTSSTQFTAVATPVTGGPQAKDDCKALSITNTGLKAATGSTTNGTCW